MQFNIPTLLTLFRVILIPFFCIGLFICLSPGSPFAAALIFCVAAVTDWFDGFRHAAGTRVPGLVLSLTLWQISSRGYRHGAGKSSIITAGGDITGGNDDRP